MSVSVSVSVSRWGNGNWELDGNGRGAKGGDAEGGSDRPAAVRGCFRAKRLEDVVE